MPSDRNTILERILALGLFNHRSGQGVEPDDVYAYFDEAEVPSVQGFQDWLVDE